VYKQEPREISQGKRSKFKMPMKYVYSALLLHSWGQPVTEENVKKVVSAAGGQVEESQVKALVAALSEVNIDDALKSASSMMMAPAAAPAAAPAEGKKKEEKPAEDEKKKEEEALAGLGALFG
jgi:large subunit ribosomal protein L12